MDQQRQNINLKVSCLTGLAFFFLIMFAACEKKCSGCPSEMRWSTEVETEPYCYPTEEACEESTNSKCYKCD